MDLEEANIIYIMVLAKNKSCLPGLSNSKNFSFIDWLNIEPIHFLLKLFLDILWFLLIFGMFPSINFLTNY